jgi:excisionase family DNA binding protein
MSGPYLSVDECAGLLGVSAKCVRGLIEREELPAYRVGRLIRIDPAALEALRYRPGDRDPVAPVRRSRPRPVTGEFSRRARGVV